MHKQVGHLSLSLINLIILYICVWFHITVIDISMYIFLFAIQKGGVVYNRETDSFDVIPGENVKMVRPSKQTHEEL